MNKIAIGTILAALPVIGGGVVFYDGINVDRHTEIRTDLGDQMFADNVDVSLELVEAKLKMLRTIEERRELTPDEKDEKAYLEERRKILLAEQRKRRA